MAWIRSQLRLLSTQDSLSEEDSKLIRVMNESLSLPSVVGDSDELLKLTVELVKMTQRIMMFASNNIALTHSEDSESTTARSVEEAQTPKEIECKDLHKFKILPGDEAHVVRKKYGKFCLSLHRYTHPDMHHEHTPHTQTDRQTDRRTDKK